MDFEMLEDKLTEEEYKKIMSKTHFELLQDNKKK